jgi:perosamine synthetase
VALSGAKPVFADIDYWAGTLVPEKAEAQITPRTKAIIAGNPNGHPAPWAGFRALAQRTGLALIEDSTEAIGSIYMGKRVGGFGDCAVFDFAQPSALTCGEGGMVVTDNPEIAVVLRRHRARRPEERSSVVLGGVPPHQAQMSDLSAALGLAQLRRIEAILAKRKQTEHWYYQYIKSFEGIKDPYIAPDVDEVNWYLYLVHLGTRFSKSSRDAIIEDLRTERVEAAPYCQPLHLQRFYFDQGYRRGAFFVTEKVADRAVALPFHTHLDEDQIAFVVGTMKDASINIGAGAAIYL